MVFSTGYTFLYDLSTAMIYDANQALSGWGQEYLCDGVKANSMSVDATYPVGISDHPFLQLLRYADMSVLLRLYWLISP